MDPENKKKVEEHLLLRSLLEYTQKEQSKTYFDYRLRLEAEDFDDLETIAGLKWIKDVPPVGNEQLHGKKYKFPPNQAMAFFDEGQKRICFLTDEGKLGWGRIRGKISKGEVTIVDDGKVPKSITAITIDDWIHKNEHQKALIKIAADYLDSESLDSVASALIRRELPNETGERYVLLPKP